MRIRRFITLLCLPLYCYGSYSVEDLSLEQKVGQLLMCHFKGKEANEDAKILIQDLHVGGIIYYSWANELSSPLQVLHLSQGLQELSKDQPPLFIAIDQEGGILSRLTQGFTVFPGNGALGVIKDPELAQEAAYATGRELRAVGINMNLAPVVDVNTNSYNPVIGIRSFGHNIGTVIALGKATIQGYHDAQIITSLKHFPGHGDTSLDSHEHLPYLHKTKQQLKQVEWFPFAALAADTDTIMTAHVMIPSMDPYHCATLSKDILDVLRIRLRFEGLIISDSLVMKGLLEQCPSIEDAALQAFNAGCDILLLGGKQLIGARIGYELTPSDIEKIHAHLVQAVKDGLIPEDRLNASVQRILDLKAKYSLLPPKTLPLDIIHSHENQLLAKKIAALALQITKKSSITSLHSSHIALFAPSMIQKSILQHHLSTLTTSLFFATASPTPEETEQALMLAQNHDVSIFCTYNAWKYPSQASLVHTLIKKGKPVIVLILSDPVDATLFPDAEGLITTYSPTTSSVEVAIDYLCDTYFNSCSEKKVK